MWVCVCGGGGAVVEEEVNRPLGSPLSPSPSPSTQRNRTRTCEMFTTIRLPMYTTAHQ